MNKEKHSKVLAAAEKLFNRFGVKKTAVDEIASLAKVAKGTIYNHFGSKEGVLGELIKQKLQLFQEKADVYSQSIKDPAVRLRAVLSERIKILINTPFLWDSMLDTNAMSLKDLKDEIDRHSLNIINKILNQGLVKTISSAEKNQILDTILFTIRGMEQSLRDSLGQISMDKIEQDLTYLIKAMIPEQKILHKK